MHPLNWTATFLSAVGAINWGLATFFRFNLVDYLGNMVDIDFFKKTVYGIIALSGFYTLVSLFVR